jgi:formylglycine-generating enzyme required for sulfatase activity
LAVDTLELNAALHCGGTYSSWTDTIGSQEKLPMNCIDWYEAFAFCAWDGGRLPTEAEWNYAAAGGMEQRAYPWGSGIIDGTYAVYDCTGDGNAGCGLTDIQPVGSRSPKGDGWRGQSDLAGNMWEWMLDGYDDYLLPCNDCAQLLAPDRVVRGGGFVVDASNLLSAVRDYVDPTVRYYSVGARCARTQ